MPPKKIKEARTFSQRNSTDDEGVITTTDKEIKDIVSSSVDLSVRAALEDYKNSIMKTVQSKLSALTEEIQIISDEKDALVREVSDLKNKSSEQTEQIETIKQQGNKDMWNEVMVRSNDNEQYMRWSIRIHGHPLSDRPKEDCKKEVISILHTKLKLNFITENDIDAANPISRSRDEKPPAIIVRFFKRDIISKILATRRDLKKTSHVITEDLTNLNQKLLNRARFHNNINTAWSWNGSIWCVTKAGHKIKLRLYEDINERIRNASRQHHQHQDRHIPTIKSAETTSVPVNSTTTPMMSTITTLPTGVGVTKVLNNTADSMDTTSTASAITTAAATPLKNSTTTGATSLSASSSTTVIMNPP